MMTPSQTGTSLAGQLLVAMPGMPDPRFAKSVVYVCAHNEDGAMGLVINRSIDEISFPDLLQQLGIDSGDEAANIGIHFGGPVETRRGFVLHSPDYNREGTLIVTEDVALTATIDILKSIATGSGPRERLLALGYAGWAPGQLDSEIMANGWLTVEADDDLLFHAELNLKWDRAMAKLGIDPLLLSDSAGHA